MPVWAFRAFSMRAAQAAQLIPVMGISIFSAISYSQRFDRDYKPVSVKRQCTLTGNGIAKSWMLDFEFLMLDFEFWILNSVF
jgi:hypothetical protein